MTDFLPFPFGLFTEAEWHAAYRFCLDEADAEQQAASNAAVTAAEAERTHISEVDLAFLSLVSEDLGGRVARAPGCRGLRRRGPLRLVRRDPVGWPRGLDLRLPQT